MKKTKILISAICLAIMIVGNSSASYAQEAQKPYIKEIKVLKMIVKHMYYPYAIGCAPIYYFVEVVMSDETVVLPYTTNAEKVQYTEMNWKLERYDDASNTYTQIETSEGSHFFLWLPYGTKEGKYKITATSKVDPSVSGFTWEYMKYSDEHKNFCVFQKGSVKYGKIRGKEPGPGKIKIESFNTKNGLYTSIVPECPYRTKDYTFTGWKTGRKLYQPGEKFTASGYEQKHIYFQAQWKPNFKKPELIANKAGKNKIKLRWNRMVGGRGYKIYRAEKKNGKYKLAGTVKNRLKTAWTDREVRSGKTYYYKVAAYKKSKKKIHQKKSEWAVASTKAAEIKSVKLSGTSIQGKVGQSARIKAVVKTTKGKRLSKKVRWYTSDQKIAKVNQNTGKITFVKAGTCRVWAKAYSGKDSPKAKVVIVQ